MHSLSAADILDGKLCPGHPLQNLGPCGFAKIDYATLKLAYKPVGSMYGLFS